MSSGDDIDGFAPNAVSHTIYYLHGALLRWSVLLTSFGMKLSIVASHYRFKYAALTVIDLLSNPDIIYHDGKWAVLRSTRGVLAVEAFQVAIAKLMSSKKYEATRILLPRGSNCELTKTASTRQSLILNLRNK